ncbi:MAG: hypothetical protein R3A44_05920 [Caldilineaceae bacterium]
MNTVASTIYQAVIGADIIGDYTKAHLSAQEREALVQLQSLLATPPRKLSELLAGIDEAEGWFKHTLIIDESS